MRACACVYVRLICVCVCIVRRYVTPSVIYYDSIWWLKVVTAVMFSEGFFFLTQAVEISAVYFTWKYRDREKIKCHLLTVPLSFLTGTQTHCKAREIMHVCVCVCVCVVTSPLREILDERRERERERKGKLKDMLT